MRNVLVKETEPVKETVLEARVLRKIEKLLPSSWRLELLANQESLLPGLDIERFERVSLVAPSGERVDFLFVTRGSGISSTQLLAQLGDLARGGEMPVVFISDYIGPRLRSELTSAGFSYADATGWVSIVSDFPLVLLTGQGAAKSPRRRGSTAVVRLNGVAVNRIIRALTTVPTPVRVNELADIAGVSPSSVSKLLPTLVREGVIDRDERGRVSKVQRWALVQRWTQDYSYSKTNDSVGFFIAPRGLKRTMDRLEEISTRVTLTGSAAARELLPAEVTPVVPLRLLAIYTDQPDDLVEELGLIPADPSTANIAIAVPQALEVLNAPLAPPALVLADLLTLPGRGDAEAEQLAYLLAQTDKELEPQ